MNKLAIALALSFVSGIAAADGFMPWTDVFSKFDADKDGSVSMQEADNHQLGQDFVGFYPFMKDHFADLDANHDGKVTRDELAAMMHTKEWTDKDLVNQFYKNTGFMAANPENQ